MDIKLEKLKLQIGCMIRLGRLKKGYSQFELSLLFDSNSTLVGRIERGETVAGWDKIFILTNLLDIKIDEIFTITSKNNLLNIVKEARKLDGKLTAEKSKYYDNLTENVKEIFDSSLLGEDKEKDKSQKKEKKKD